jgi:WD40 repeat protein
MLEDLHQSGRQSSQMKWSKGKKWLLIMSTIILAVIMFAAIILTKARALNGGRYLPFPVYLDNNKTSIYWISASDVSLLPDLIEGRVTHIECSSRGKCFFILASDPRNRLFPTTSIHTIEPSSKTVHRIVESKPNIHHLRISVAGDGNRVAVVERQFTKQPFGKSVLEVIDSEGNRLSTLELGQAELVSNLRWSPLGDRLVVAMYDLEAKGSQLLRKRRLVVLNDKLSLMGKLALIPTPNAALAWSPDGREIACSVVTQSGAPSVVVEQVNGGKQRLLWQGNHSDYYISQIEWLPNALFVLTKSDTHKTIRLFSVDPITGQQEFELLLPFAKSVCMSCKDVVAFMDNGDVKWFQLPTFRKLSVNSRNNNRSSVQCLGK